MKFLIVLAFVALASANLNLGYGRRSYGGSVLSSRSSYGSGLSGLSLGGGYSSGGSYGSGLSGLSLGGGYSGGYSSGLGLGNAKLALIQAVPVSLASQQVAIAQPSVSLGLGASYGSGLALGGGSYGASYGASQQLSGPITAAIQSTRNVQVVDVASNQQVAAPAQIVIGPSVQPIDIEFQSQSSPVSVRQTHIPGQANAPQSSSHQEEPDYLRQEIVKPVIHEVTEAIQPYRKVTQEVRPVLETINQLITRGQQQQTVVAQPSYSSQFVASAAPAVAVSAQPTLALVTSAQPVSVGLTGSQGYGSGLSLGGSYGGSLLGSSLGSGYGSDLSLGSSSLGSGLSLGSSSLGSSSLGYGSSLGSSSLGYGGSLSGSTLVSKPSSVSVSSVDNYRRRA